MRPSILVAFSLLPSSFFCLAKGILLFLRASIAKKALKEGTVSHQGKDVRKKCKAAFQQKRTDWLLGHFREKSLKVAPSSFPPFSHLSGGRRKPASIWQGSFHPPLPPAGRREEGTSMEVLLEWKKS